MKLNINRVIFLFGGLVPVAQNNVLPFDLIG
jgi:hypothetical protein